MLSLGSVGFRLFERRPPLRRRSSGRQGEARVLKKLRSKLLLSGSATLLCLVAAEVLVRVFGLAPDDASPRVLWEHAAPADGAPRLHILTGSGELYALNPQHEEISEQGFRSEAVQVPKPAGVFRILILGDSVAYGHGVDRQAAFPQQLQLLLRDAGRTVEVVNAAVSGYTAYNELQAYLARGRQLQPDLVLVAMCLNDVVNPRLHWGVTAGKLISIPDEAIPDLDYDRNVIQPRIADALRIDRSELTAPARTLADEFALYRFVRSRTSRPTDAPVQLANAASAAPGAATALRRPTFLTGEDSLSIEVLMDEASAERRWLHSIYARLADAVASDRSRLAIVVLPLAYQLDRDYPWIPQHDLVRSFEAAGWPGLDLLPALQEHPAKDVFLMQREGFRDVWHLTETGHACVARAIADFLAQRQLLGEDQDRAPSAPPR